MTRLVFAAALIACSGCSMIEQLEPEHWDTLTEAAATVQNDVTRSTLYTPDGRRISCTTYTAGKSSVTRC